MSMFSMSLYVTVNFYFVSKFGGYADTASVGISHVIANALAFAPIFSINIGFLNIASQAYGAGSYQLVGRYYQHAFIINGAWVIVSSIIVCFINRLLRLTNLEDEVQELSYHYLLLIIPSFFAMLIFDTTKNLLMVQGQFTVQSIIMILTTLFHFGLNYVFYEHFNFAFEGVPVAFDLAQSLGAIGLIVFIVYTRYCKDTWLPWGRESFQDLWPFLKQTIPIALSVYAEWIGLEVLTALATFLGGLQIAILSVAINVISLVFEFPLGISTTFGSFLANSIGEKNLPRAKRIVLGGVLLNVLVVGLLAVILLFWGEQLGHLYSDDPAVIAGYAEIKWVIIVGIFLDMFAVTNSSILRAIGCENFAMWSYVSLYTAFGIASGIVIVFVLQWERSSKGLLMGLFLGEVLFDVVSLIKILSTSFSEQMESVNERVTEALLREELNQEANKATGPTGLPTDARDDHEAVLSENHNEEDFEKVKGTLHDLENVNPPRRHNCRKISTTDRLDDSDMECDGNYRKF